MVLPLVFLVIGALAILSALRLQANTIIRHRNRDSTIIGGKRHSHRQPEARLLRSLAAWGQGISGDTRFVGSVEGQLIEVATELTIEGGAQGTHQPMLEMALVRYRRGAHQCRQVMMRHAQFVDDRL